MARVTAALAPARAGALLERLHQPQRLGALREAQRFGEETAAHQNALLASLFAPRPDATERLRDMCAELSPKLQAAIYRSLPPHYRSALRPPEPADAAHPAAAALAERLVSEAIFSR